MNQRELALIDAIVREDRQAMAELYDIYRPRVARFLRGMVADEEQIDEIINDVMMTVWEKAATFEGRSAVSTWVFGIAYRRALDLLRKAKRYQEVLGSFVAPSAPASIDCLADRDLGIIMKSLTPEQYAVAKLTFEFGYSYPEIAGMLDIPVNTVKTRMFHARKALQRAFSDGMVQ